MTSEQLDIHDLLYIHAAPSAMLSFRRLFEKPIVLMWASAQPDYGIEPRSANQ